MRRFADTKIIITNYLFVTQKKKLVVLASIASGFLKSNNIVFKNIFGTDTN